MEEIIKKITLIDFKNFNPNVNIKCLDEEESGNCWSKIPMDLIITNDILKTIKIPFVKKIDDNGNEYTVLRYYDIKKLFLFFELYESLMEYYRLIEIKGVKRWHLCEKPNTFIVLATLPPVDDFECGAYIGVNPLYEEYLNYTNNGDEECKNAIKEMFETYFSNDSSLSYDVPYINMPLYLSTDITDCGEMLNTLQKWTPLKQYYIGDIVFYENEYYVATNDSASNTFVKDNWDMLNLKKPTNSNLEQLGVEVYSESRLNYFLPQRRTYNINGEIMPFIYDDATKRGFLLYKQGYTNYTEKEDGIFVDYLEKTEVRSNGEWVLLEPDDEPDNETGFVLTTTRGMYEIINGKVLKLQYENVDAIKFTYIIDAQAKDGVLISGTGVKYEEVRSCYKSTITTNINGKEETYEYLFINDLSDFSKNKELKVSYAKILDVSLGDRFKIWERGTRYFYGEVVFDYLTDSYYKCIVKGNRGTTDGLDKKSSWQILNFSHLYVDDRLFGTSYVDVDLPKIPIDRGNYTAMERHYVLGEVNSFDDLEKYRNNLFKL